MFTGLVETVGTITNITRRGGVTIFRIAADFAGELATGQSIAVSGACTTVTSCDTHTFTVELTDETIGVTRFGAAATGERVNLERALPVTARLDGHIVAGHVDGTALVLSLKKNLRSAELRLNLPRELTRYVVYKGSICVDGISLTVASIRDNVCTVAVIPETLERTTLGTLTAGRKVNIETDILARYVEKLLGIEAQETAPASGLTEEKLRQMGW